MKEYNGKSGRLKKMFGSRFVAGSWSAFAAIIVIVIAVVANLTVGSLPANITQRDLTGNNIYSLSDQTRQIAASLEKDVVLYLLATTGSENETIVRFLNQYAALSDHLSMKTVDPGVEPAFLNKYKLEADKLFQNSVIVDCGTRYRLVGYNEIFVTSYSVNQNTYSYETSTAFAGENAITKAVHYVASDRLPKVYTLKGHGEEELSGDMKDLIVQDNMETDSLSLLSLDAVPDDAAVVMINKPEKDLGDDETNVLISYLQKGGNIMLMTDYIENKKMPNLLKITREMGLSTVSGIIIEGDQNRRISRYPHYILPEMSEHEITSALKKAGYYIMTPVAQPIVQEKDTTAKITWLLTTSSSAYAKQAALSMKTTDKEDGDTDGPFHVAAVSTAKGKLIWFSSGNMLNNNVDRTVAGGNSNLILNAINWLGGQKESISIRPKAMNEEKLIVPSASSRLWSIIMIGVIPMCLVFLGIWITIRRKRR